MQQASEAWERLGQLDGCVGGWVGGCTTISGWSSLALIVALRCLSIGQVMLMPCSLIFVVFQLI